jgi:hypothetical protein
VFAWISNLLVGVKSDERPLVVRPRAALAEQPDACVLLGTAADGLPLVLQVTRRASVAQSVMSALGYPPRHELSDALTQALDRLEEAVHQRAKELGLTLRRGKKHYVTRATAAHLLGDTLLVRLLGEDSPILLPEDRFASGGGGVVPITGAVAMAEDTQKAIQSIGQHRRLAVPLADGAIPQIVDANSGDDEVPPRPLLAEDLRGIPSASWHAEPEPPTHELVTGSLHDERAYQKALMRDRSVAWSISTADACRLVAQLARGVAQLHETGVVHADLKPANVLLTAQGAQPIDPLRVPVGTLAYGATPGWCAPEQILARPVSPATDVFPLGLLLCRIVGGAIHGEERTHVVPTGGTERRRMRLLAQADVFLDPRQSPFDDRGRRVWQSFLARCLALDPAARFGDANAFAEALDALLHAHEPQGHLPLRGGPGVLQRNVEIVGRVGPAWVIRDDR